LENIEHFFLLFKNTQHIRLNYEWGNSTTKVKAVLPFTFLLAEHITRHLNYSLTLSL
jgi:hypothetical protein